MHSRLYLAVEEKEVGLISVSKKLGCRRRHKERETDNTTSSRVRVFAPNFFSNMKAYQLAQLSAVLRQISDGSDSVVAYHCYGVL